MKTNIFRLILLAVLMALISATSPIAGKNETVSAGIPDSTTAETSSGVLPEDEIIKWQVISAGGGVGTDGEYQLRSTTGQTAVGTGTDGEYGLGHGYWQNFIDSAGVCDCTPGNANGDALTNIFDITYLISFLYKGGPPPTPYPICSGDPNGLGCTCNIFDATYLISFLYKGGPDPVTCEDWLTACGPPLR